MKTIKNIVNVKDHKITVELPKDFNFEQVEVIILPCTKEKKINSNKLDWDDIVGISEFEQDASINHDKYINKTL